MRVTADTNIYISALNYDGEPRAFLRLASAGAFRLSISDEILDEIREVLSRKFHWPEDKVAEAHTLLGLIAERVRPTVRLDVVKDDPDDNRVLECAQSAGAECLVTGDRDLLRLRNYDSIRIMTVAEFLREYRERREAVRWP